ncbi:hypothetical protein [Yeguia hominis]|uniref:Uncharacterized protein n=1 Tax=Yeguia hominis TaxID=2763662 RepID=A0A926HTS5_9FIRM|nr:hypothetical protein [Yeguia hominis]MBC8534771.1 hypothetical protein [Yeguia hominis]
MKLFDTIEAVKFPEENMIFITRGGYLYYIYNPKYKWWRKHSNAGNDHLTISNYPDVSREELVDAMKGVFPKKETDFMRLCNSSQLCIRDMLDLLKEDYPKYMADYAIYHTIHRLLLESDICHKSFEKLQKLLEDATTNHHNSNQVLTQIKNLSFAIIGRDIFKREIGIVDGHDSSSYFWIMPVRVIDFENTADLDSVAEMRSAEISIEEDDVAQYLTPFLYKYFDEELTENKKRKDVSGFEWYLEHNFFTFDSMALILKDIEDTVDALSSGRETEYTQKLKIKRGTATYQLVYAKNLTAEEVAEYNANRPTEDDTAEALVVDFYQRFLYRMEHMLKVGKEKGYNLISFMGP